MGEETKISQTTAYETGESGEPTEVETEAKVESTSAGGDDAAGEGGGEQDNEE